MTDFPHPVHQRKSRDCPRRGFALAGWRQLPALRSVNVHRMEGKTQAGYFLCNDCRDKFTCRTGTVMERSHIPVHKWLLAIHLLSSKEGHVGAPAAPYARRDLQDRMVPGASHPRSHDAKPPGPMGGAGKPVQADETYYGNTSKRAKGYGRAIATRPGRCAR